MITERVSKSSILLFAVLAILALVAFVLNQNVTSGGAAAPPNESFVAKPEDFAPSDRLPASATDRARESVPGSNRPVDVIAPSAPVVTGASRHFLPIMDIEQARQLPLYERVLSPRSEEDAQWMLEAFYPRIEDIASNSPEREDEYDFYWDAVRAARMLKNNDPRWVDEAIKAATRTPFAARALLEHYCERIHAFRHGRRMPGENMISLMSSAEHNAMLAVVQGDIEAAEVLRVCSPHNPRANWLVTLGEQIRAVHGTNFAHEFTGRPTRTIRVRGMRNLEEYRRWVRTVIRQR